MKPIITGVKQGSIAEELGISKGDELISINECEINDILDYKLLTEDEYLVLEIFKPDINEIWEYEIEKDIDESIGLIFEHLTIDKPRDCKNNCIFCFMAQMPDGLRETLSFKDDDYRLSFLDGNYITLTNVSDEELERIIKLHLSPLNISVHTTNPDLRVKMMKNPRSKEILNQLRKLQKANITINIQLVLCPEYNNGKELERTLQDLLEFDNISSLSAVPVGLTKYRKERNLTNLRSFTKEEAAEVIDIMEEYSKKYFEKYSSRTVYPSDEFFILAQRDIPKTNYYEEFIQYENGVGMVSLLEEETKEALETTTVKKPQKNSFTIITGMLFCDKMKEITNTINKKFPEIKIDVLPIKNEFWGEKITVAGLLTGRDIISQCKQNYLNDIILICETSFNDDGLMLDNLTKEDLEKELNRQIKIVKNDGFALVDTIIKEA